MVLIRHHTNGASILPMLEDIGCKRRSQSSIRSIMKMLLYLPTLRQPRLRQAIIILEQLLGQDLAEINAPKPRLNSPSPSSCPYSKRFQAFWDDLKIGSNFLQLFLFLCPTLDDLLGIAWRNGQRRPDIGRAIIRPYLGLFLESGNWLVRSIRSKESLTRLRLQFFWNTWR